MTQCHRLSLCVSGGRRHVIHAAEAVDGLSVREDVLRAPDPRMSAQLRIERITLFNDCQLRRLAVRRTIAVDIPAGGVYTIRRRFWREYLRTPCGGEGGCADHLLFLHIQQVVQVRSAICVVSDQKRTAIDRVVVYGFFLRLGPER